MMHTMHVIVCGVATVGDILPTTPLEVFLVLLFMLCGVSMVALLVGSVAELLTQATADARRAHAFRHKMTEVGTRDALAGQLLPYVQQQLHGWHCGVLAFVSLDRVQANSGRVRRLRSMGWAVAYAAFKRCISKSCTTPIFTLGTPKHLHMSRGGESIHIDLCSSFIPSPQQSNMCGMLLTRAAYGVMPLQSPAQLLHLASSIAADMCAACA